MRKREHLAMSWSAVSATVLPLVGVALGTSGTLLGQYVVTRSDARRERHRRTEARRLEGKEAIVGFVAAVQHVEQLGIEGRLHAKYDDDAIRAALRQLWVAKKVIELTCSGVLAQKAHDYAWELHKNLQPSTLDGMPDSERLVRIDFLENARRELGIAAEAITRKHYQDLQASGDQTPL